MSFKKYMSSKIFTLIGTILCITAPIHAAEMEWNDTPPNKSHAPEQQQSQKKHEEWDVEEFNKMLTEMDPYVKEGKGRAPILFIGTTGAGKSATLNYLLGYTMQLVALECQSSGGILQQLGLGAVEKVEVIEVANPNNENLDGPAPIGHKKTEAKTLFPALYREKVYELDLCDFAGLFDTRGLATRAGIAISSKAMINQAKNIKAVVFVIDRPSLETSRAQVFQGVLSMLNNMFLNPTEHVASIYFAFTKRNGWERNNFIGMLAKILDELKTKSNKMWSFGKQKEQSVMSDDQKIYAFFFTMLKEHLSHFFVVDPLNEKAKGDILFSLKQSHPIAPSVFQFIGDQALLHKIVPFYHDYALKGIAIIQKLVSLPKECTAKEIRLTMLQEDIEDAKQEDIEDAKKEREAIKKEKGGQGMENYLKSLATKISELEKKIDAFKAEKKEMNGALLKEKAELSSIDTAVREYNKVVYTRNDMRRESAEAGFWWWSSNGYDRYEIAIEEHVGIPVLDIKHKYEDGSVSNVNKKLNIGSYSAYYQCDAAREPKITITFYASGRDIDAGRIRASKMKIASKQLLIAEQEEEIQEWKEEKKSLEKKEERLWLSNQELARSKEWRQEKKERKIAKLQAKYEKTRSSLDQQSKELSKLRQALQKEQLIFDLIESTLPYLHISEGSIPYFVSVYKQFKATQPLLNLNSFVQEEEEKKNNEG